MKFPLGGLLLVASLTCNADALTADGSAPIVNGDIGLARWKATANALRAAAEQNGAELRATTLVNNGAVYETLSINAAIRTTKSRIVDESVMGQSLNVTVLADVASKETANIACGTPYRKRVVIAGIPMSYPEQLQSDEMYGYATGTARELAKIFYRENGFETLVDNTAFIYKSPQAAPALQNTLVFELFQRHRAQYVVSGVIRQFYLEKPAAVFGFALARNRRVVEIEFIIHEGLTGAAFAKKTFSREAVGSVIVPRGTEFGGKAFYETDLGNAFAGLLDEAARWISMELRCSPFTARVIQANGQLIEIDAGSDSGINDGDMLIVYSRRASNKAAKGYDTLPLAVASASIVATGPNRATAKLGGDGQTIDVHSGDLVSSW